MCIEMKRHTEYMTDCFERLTELKGGQVPKTGGKSWKHVQKLGNTEFMTIFLETKRGKRGHVHQTDRARNM